MYSDSTFPWVPYGTDSELDKFVDSNKWEDRLKAAEQRYGLDKLINDSDSRVRLMVAGLGFGLDILANDASEYVREAVAYQGYGLNKLLYDASFNVSLAATRYLIDNYIYDISTWIKQNPDKCVEYRFIFLDKFLYNLEKRSDIFEVVNKMQDNKYREFLIPSISKEFVLLHVTHIEDYVFICSSLHFKNGNNDERSAIVYNQIDLDNYIFNLADILNQHKETRKVAKVLLDCAI